MLFVDGLTSMMGFQKAKLKAKTKGGDTNGGEGVDKCGKFHDVSDNKHHGK